MIEGRPRESLVMYDPPIEVSLSDMSSKFRLLKILVEIYSLLCLFDCRLEMVWTPIASKRSPSAVSEMTIVVSYLLFSIILFVIAAGSRKTLPPLEDRPNAEAVLDTMLPPREWVEQGKHYIQYVSHEPASRIDVARLREMLDQKLLER